MTIAREIKLPPGFEDLEPFVPRWGHVETAEERYLVRQDTPYEELAAFHTAAHPRLEPIFSYLDHFPMDDLPPPENLLYRLCLGLIEASLAVEFFGQSRMLGAPYPHTLTFDQAVYKPG
jgi:hypothetical protein